MAEGVLLYLVRHGIAADRGDKYPDDATRPLTPRGVSRLKQIAAGLVALDVRLDAVLTSPYVRARQTAEVLAQAWPRPPRIIDVPALAAGGKPAAVIEELGRHAKRGSLALVGHAPDIGELAARLIGSRRGIEFGKGAVCCVEVDQLPPSGAGALRWFLTPRMLRRLARTG